MVGTNAGPPAKADEHTKAFLQTMTNYMEARKTEITKDEKKNKLSFTLSDRLKEVGLEHIYAQARPTEEAMIKIEARAKVATDQNRVWIGSAEGEDIQVQFRPKWARTPKIEVASGNGSFEDKLKNLVEGKKARTVAQKTDFYSYANFQGHVLEWGIKMITLKAFNMVDLISYQYILAGIAEQHQGSSTAFAYDLNLRLKMARELENGVSNIRPFLNTIDQDVLSESKGNVKSDFQSAARDAKGKGKGKSKSKASNKGQYDHKAWQRGFHPFSKNSRHPKGQGNNYPGYDRQDRSRSPHGRAQKGGKARGQQRK